MNDSTQTKGGLGERIAARVLQEKGFYVLKRNLWLTIPKIGRREIDLVCARGDLLILVEVRTRFHKHSNDYSAFDSISPRKLQHMLEAAEYLLANRPDWIPPQITQARIDLVCIDFFGDTAKTHHITDLRPNSAKDSFN